MLHVLPTVLLPALLHAQVPKNYAFLTSGGTDDEDDGGGNEGEGDKNNGAKKRTSKKAAAGSGVAARQQLTGFEGCESLFQEGVWPVYHPGRCQAHHAGEWWGTQASLLATVCALVSIQPRGRSTHSARWRFNACAALCCAALQARCWCWRRCSKPSEAQSQQTRWCWSATTQVRERSASNRGVKRRAAQQVYEQTHLPACCAHARTHTQRRSMCWR